MSSTPTQKQSNSLPGNDPLMGQLEVIEPGIAMFHGFANVAFAYGRGEMIVVDTSSREMGAQAVRAIREVSEEPFAFIIYTHGHGDHSFGTEAFINDAITRGHARPKIWAQENVAGRFKRYALTRGWQSQINRLPQPRLSRSTISRPGGRAGRAASCDGRDGRRDLGLDADAAARDGRRSDRLVDAEHRQSEQGATLHARMGGGARGDREARAAIYFARPRPGVSRRAAMRRGAPRHGARNPLNPRRSCAAAQRRRVAGGNRRGRHLDSSRARVETVPATDLRMRPVRRARRYPRLRRMVVGRAVANVSGQAQGTRRRRRRAVRPQQDPRAGARAQERNPTETRAGTRRNRAQRESNRYRRDHIERRNPRGDGRRRAFIHRAQLLRRRRAATARAREVGAGLRAPHPRQG